ncbi:MAG: hypothetical protein ILA12_04445, partial [Butyrivibrio sp.]|nr:hypothetical protein [Butyrivibrio sp.]
MMVRIKRAISLLLMTILIMTNATIAYAGEADGTDILVESREGKEETLEKKKEEEPVAESSQKADNGDTTDAVVTDIVTTDEVATESTPDILVNSLKEIPEEEVKTPAVDV